MPSSGNTTLVMGQQFGATDVAPSSQFGLQSGSHVDLLLDSGWQRMVNIMTNSTAMASNGSLTMSIPIESLRNRLLIARGQSNLGSAFDRLYDGGEDINTIRG